jgi:hypothetical protein
MGRYRGYKRDPISAADTSGNALDATAAGAQRPTLETASVINAKPAAAFDATNTQFFDLPVGFADFTLGTALYIVHSPIDEFAQALAMFGLSDNLAASAYSWIIDTSNEGAGVIALQPGFFQLTNVGVQSYAPTILESHIPAGAGGSLQASEVSLNHVVIAAGAFPVPNNVARNLNYVGNDAIAGVARYRGVIAEVILYDRALTALERAEMDAYLLDRYAL